VTPPHATRKVTQNVPSLISFPLCAHDMRKSLGMRLTRGSFSHQQEGTHQVSRGHLGYSTASCALTHEQEVNS